MGKQKELDIKKQEELRAKILKDWGHCNMVASRDNLKEVQEYAMEVMPKEYQALGQIIFHMTVNTMAEVIADRIIEGSLVDVNDEYIKQNYDCLDCGGELYSGYKKVHNNYYCTICGEKEEKK